MANCFLYHPFWGKFDLNLTWFIKSICALTGCTLDSSIMSVSETASKIWPMLLFFTHIEEKFELEQRVIECALLGSAVVPSMKSVSEI